MRILAIETSCDETALAIVDASGDLKTPRFEVVSTALFSQIDIHRAYGGVFPAIAKREHASRFVPLLDELLQQQTGTANTTVPLRTEPFDASTVDWQNIETLLAREPELFAKLKAYVETHEKPLIDMIAVTSGPGLEPALWVGINAARALSQIWNIPMLPVNHMEGHVVSVLLEAQATAFPALAALISGGHTELVLVDAWGSYKKIGQTKDDAIGEAYDKVARMLGLPYPGGPEIAALAERARREGVTDDTITLPRPMQHTSDFDFSLSGLKTAVLYKVQALGELTENHKLALAREFEQAVVDVLVTKVRRAIEAHHVQSLIVGGGVIANQYIRDALQTVATKAGISVHFPTRELSTDNAVMIAIAGFMQQHTHAPTICPDIRANGGLSLSL